MEKENTCNFTLFEEIGNTCNCSSSNKISKVYLINASDCIVEDRNVRIKSEYGKFKRKAIVIDK